MELKVTDTLSALIPMKAVITDEEVKKARRTGNGWSNKYCLKKQWSDFAYDQRREECKG
jgi:hypothetical protein